MMTDEDAPVIVDPLGLPRRVRTTRPRRELTRIKRDIRGWIGWDYIEECANRCEDPLAVYLLFETGGRATEVLALSRENFADMGAYYEVREMPVFKKYNVVQSYRLPNGKVLWETELVTEFRTFPILKSEPLAKAMWDEIQDKNGRLLVFRRPPTVVWDGNEPIVVEGRPWHDQYWQLYKVIAKIDPPDSPLAPRDKRGKKKNLYPHWFRGMRAAQLRVEYGLTADDLMEFFRWEDPEMALYYTSLTSYELAEKMIRGRDIIRRSMGMSSPGL